MGLLSPFMNKKGTQVHWATGRRFGGPLDGIMGVEAPLTKTRGKKHDYHISTLHYQRLCTYSMWRRILSSLTFSKDKTIFNKKLSYSCSCVSMHDPMPRPPSVAFLRTCVEPPHENKKLSQMMKYLRVSIGMPLTLEASCLDIMELWVNGSYAGHPDMLNHTGGTMSLGLPVLKCWSRLAGICPIQSTIIKSLIAPLGVCRTSPMVRMTKMHIETIETTQKLADQLYASDHRD
jgi:hypothetical protein